MAHIYLVDRTWIDILTGHSMAAAMASSDRMKEWAETAGLEELETMSSELAARYKRL